MVGLSPGAKEAQLDFTEGKSEPCKACHARMPSGKCLQSLNSQPTHWGKPSLPLKPKPSFRKSHLPVTWFSHNFPGTFANH